MRTDGVESTLERRRFLRVAVGTGGALVAGCATSRVSGAGTARPDGAAEARVTPGEDLMQEHGALERILLIYEEAANCIDAGRPLDPGVIVSAAGIVRRFVEDYHERLEEQYVFPRMRTAPGMDGLVSTLLRQHERGRVLTDDLLRRVEGPVTTEWVPTLRSFVRMYRPHAAREETVLLPAFRKRTGRGAYDELGERFEGVEHERFGANGFEATVSDIARLEVALGIGDLGRFTPA